MPHHPPHRLSSTIHSSIGAASSTTDSSRAGLEALGEVNCGASRAAGFQAQTAQERSDFPTAMHRTPVSCSPHQVLSWHSSPQPRKEGTGLDQAPASLYQREEPASPVGLGFL
uniref:Uncharacterized protein n=1 Tax=Pipistrellus kuhlii TaxID=59472 RepID=A0A7J7USE5_PIPKU|nr:hypothetical protein mPipKuh1_001760 [Pipistrellus kuhlii]